MITGQGHNSRLEDAVARSPHGLAMTKREVKGREQIGVANIYYNGVWIYPDSGDIIETMEVWEIAAESSGRSFKPVNRELWAESLKEKLAAKRR